MQITVLFDTDAARTRLSGRRPDEDAFGYLNESNRPEAAEVRFFLEACLQSYPEQHRVELIRRLRESDIQFASASFELFLHACFLQIGWTIEVHPEVPGGNGKRPDFRVHTDTGDAFYVEATLAREFSDAELAAERRINEVLRAINDMPSPDFLLDIDVGGSPRTNVPRRNLRHQIRRWLESLDRNEVEAQIREGRPRDELRYEHDGWIVVFKAIPRKHRGNVSGGRTIGMRNLGVKAIDIIDAVKSAAKSKASRYGEINLPLVVAINIEGDFDDVTQERDALFGHLDFFRIPRGASQGEMRPIRRHDGVWNGPRGPQYTRLSGAWLFRRFDPWHFVARGSNLLYVNPWAALPLASSALRFPHATVENGRLVEHEGVKFDDLFNLCSSWPTVARGADDAAQARSEMQGRSRES